jgi:hypothetical protein
MRPTPQGKDCDAASLVKIIDDISFNFVIGSACIAQNKMAVPFLRW